MINIKKSFSPEKDFFYYKPYKKRVYLELNAKVSIAPFHTFERSQTENPQLTGGYL